MCIKNFDNGWTVIVIPRTPLWEQLLLLINKPLETWKIASSSYTQKFFNEMLRYCAVPNDAYQTNCMCTGVFSLLWKGFPAESFTLQQFPSQMLSQVVRYFSFLLNFPHHLILTAVECLKGCDVPRLMVCVQRTTLNIQSLHALIYCFIILNLLLHLKLEIQHRFWINYYGVTLVTGSSFGGLPRHTRKAD